MRFWTFATIPVALALIASGSGCGDKDDSGASGDGTATGTGSTSGGSSSSESTGPATTSAGTMGGSGDESSTGMTDALFAGRVLDFASGEGMPIAAAQISAYDDPGVTAASDMDGNYEIGPLPLDPPPIFVIDPSTDYFGSVRPVRTGELNAPDDIDLAQVSRATVDTQMGLLDPDMSQPPDLEQAIIIVRLLNNTATGTVIDMDPPPEPGTYYAPDADGVVQLNSNVIDFNLLPVAVFYNLEPMDKGAYQITATHPERECTVERPEFPTLGEHITLVEVSCPPPG